MNTPSKATLTEKLGDAQIDTLVEMAQRKPAQPDPDSVKPYKFGHDNLSDLSDHSGLDLVNERICRLARDNMFGFLRMHPKLAHLLPGVETYANFVRDLDPFQSLTTAHIPQLRASCLLVLRPEFITLLTNTYFGGALEYHKNTKQEFTVSEARVRSLFVSSFLTTLEQAWDDVVPLTFAIQQQEDNLGFLHFVDPEEPVLRSSFIVRFPEIESALIEVIYPVQALKVIAPEIRSAMQSTVTAVNSVWRTRFHRALLNIPMEVTAQLAAVEVPLNNLASLETGKVLPLQADLNPQLLADEAPLFDVVPGQRGRLAAVSLERKLEYLTREDA
ncbi:MAG: FliM/FliN family flagellar motor switch protein [Rhodobacteraceae bacterium]|nr:FliM/FliN family flagellar motor switch protein [Paracoccaceae bacterium]